MQLDFERYECKYIIPAAMRQPIKDHIACFSQPDAYTAASGGYVITSLYLDTPSLTFHLAKMRKDLNRMKLRIRCYDDQVDGPVFFEIKRKVKGIIHKRRVMIRRPDWAEHMRGGGELQRSARTPRDAEVIDEFLYQIDRWQAFPSTLVKYSREAYQGDIDVYSRVTFDTRLVCHTPNGFAFHTGYAGWSPLDDPTQVDRLYSGVVLELKFANHAPMWMVDLVQRFGLQMRGFSKYSTSVDQLLEAYRGLPDVRVPRQAVA